MNKFSYRSAQSGGFVVQIDGFGKVSWWIRDKVPYP